jgi:beta-galactosidase
VLGIRVEDFHPLLPGVTAPLTAADEGAAGSAPGSAAGSTPGSAVGSGGLGLTGALGSLWSELLRTDGATVLARYAEGALAGLPAVTRHRFGAGTAWYVSTLPANEPLEQLLRAAATAAGLDRAGAAAPPGAAVSRRTDGNGRSWLFAFNHGDAMVTLPAAGVDLLSGREVTGTLALAAGDVAVVRELAAE